MVARLAVEYLVSAVNAIQVLDKKEIEKRITSSSKVSKVITAQSSSKSEWKGVSSMFF